LNDLAGSFEVVNSMRPFPFSKTIVLQTAIAVLVPVLPLALTMISLEDIVKRLLGILL
jgi:threonine/homoserine efflux transporter RhtA